jgi:hypothetical protein
MCVYRLKVCTDKREGERLEIYTRENCAGLLISQTRLAAKSFASHKDIRRLA